MTADDTRRVIEWLEGVSQEAKDLAKMLRGMDTDADEKEGDGGNVPPDPPGNGDGNE